MNYESYDFENHKFKKTTKKNIWQFLYIFANGFILLSLIYTLIFIIIPIIYYRLYQCCKKDARISKIGSNNISLLKERFTSENQNE